MKAAINVTRVIVGLLFIFSGLVKANDPLGLSYKMQEFFDLWHLNQLDQWTLIMSVLMNAFEIIAGVAIILGWRPKLFSWLLLLLIIFFTFLTGYAYLSGKFKNCGCFGDCLPITPLTSFIKDVVLLLLILFLFWNRKYIRPIFKEKMSLISMTIVTLFCFGIQWYALTYLPFVDCLPFKKGNNISEKMKIPAGAIPDSFAIRFTYEKGGKQYEFATSELPSDLGTYKFVSRKDKLIRKGNAEPPIKGFSLSGPSNEDSTQIILTQPHAVLLFCLDFSKSVSRWSGSFSKLYSELKKRNIPAYLVTAKPDEAPAKISSTSFADIPVLKADLTAIRTAARTNPCIYLLNAGTIVEKQSYHKVNAIIAAVKKLP
jgi:uncharacterized membrane protein YphA (DoxX/SURF4 family)